MKIIDISMPIHPDMPVWKNREEKRPVRTVERVIPRTRSTSPTSG